MNRLTPVIPVVSAVSKGTVLKRILLIGYLTAIAIATIGWASAFGWVTLWVVRWFMA
jgi:hypothetical protein